jgi:hypothetical protein
MTMTVASRLVGAVPAAAATRDEQTNEGQFMEGANHP